ELNSCRRGPAPAGTRPAAAPSDRHARSSCRRRSCPLRAADRLREPGTPDVGDGPVAGRPGPSGCCSRRAPRVPLRADLVLRGARAAGRLRGHRAGRPGHRGRKPQQGLPLRAPPGRGPDPDRSRLDGRVRTGGRRRRLRGGRRRAAQVPHPRPAPGRRGRRGVLRGLGRPAAGRQARASAAGAAQPDSRPQGSAPGRRRRFLRRGVHPRCHCRPRIRVRRDRHRNRFLGLRPRRRGGPGSTGRHLRGPRVVLRQPGRHGHGRPAATDLASRPVGPPVRLWRRLTVAGERRGTVGRVAVATTDRMGLRVHPLLRPRHRGPLEECCRRL
ncbi:MAG: hypothetical protein AVDCRST_MAG32-1165, partial [uncultured Nocardioides sp.]